MALWSIERMTKSPPTAGSVSGWQIIAVDKQSGERRVITLLTGDVQPEEGPQLFLCGLQQDYELTPNDFNQICA